MNFLYFAAIMVTTFCILVAQLVTLEVIEELNRNIQKLDKSKEEVQ